MVHAYFSGDLTYGCDGNWTMPCTKDVD